MGSSGEGRAFTDASGVCYETGFFSPATHEGILREDVIQQTCYFQAYR